MRWPGSIILGSVMLMLAASVEAQEIKVTPLGAAESITVFNRAEWTVNTGQTYQNPFDPAEIALDAVFTSPTGKKISVPAFWNAPEESGAAPTFVIRFAPTEAGSWSFNVVATEKAATRNSKKSTTFEVKQSKRAGFIRRAANNRYLQFDSGQSFFPIGINLCWANTESPAHWYEDSFKTLSSNGANYVRIWMCNPDAMLETAKSGLGRYDQIHAAMFDKILASAQDHGIGVMLCFMNHRELLVRDMWGPAGWPTFPYNGRNAGPATRPIDFFTSPEARRLFKARLRYIVARYSAFTSVAFWEIFNEQEFARVQVPLAWNREMSSYLREVDPARHLITTSARVPPAVWELPDIDLTQSHLYGDGSQVDMSSEVATSPVEFERFNKPHLVGEMGLDSKGPDIKFDPTGKGTSFHNGIWAGMLGGNAGSGIYWWWDNYVGPKNLWHEFKPAANFAASINWAGRNFQPVDLTELYHGDAKPGLADLVLLPSGGWGATCKQTIQLPPNGRPNISIPHYLYGPKHTDLHHPLSFDVDLPGASDLVLDVAQASDYAVIRISVDDKPISDLEFSALPGSPTITKTRWNEENQIYQGDVNKTYHVSIPAGHHVVSLNPIAGDWITLSQIKFTNALPSKYANLAGFAVQDKESRETLAWILNTQSNWKQDQSQENLQPQANIQLTVPNVDAGNYTAQWWDTRTGQIIRTDSITTKNDQLTITAPTFNRDVALRLQQGGKS